MGIELPAELGDVAQQVDVRWPEADEDAMRRSATAWRDAAGSLRELAARADGTARGALSTIDGATGDAARRHWDEFVDPGSGHLPVSVKDCTAAADRLDRAADRIGEAKVRIVRELVVLARNRDAANQAAAAGNPRALAGLDTLMRSTSANLAEVRRELAGSVEQVAGASPGSDGAGSALPDGPASVASLPETGAAVVDSVGGAVSELAEPSERGRDEIPGAVEPARGADPAGVPGLGVGPDVEAEPVPSAPGAPDAGTGPIPRVTNDPAAEQAAPPAAEQAPMPDPAVGTESVNPTSDTAPQAVQQAWAAPPAAAPAGTVQGGAPPSAAPAPSAPPQGPYSQGPYGQAPYGRPAHGQAGSYAPAAPPAGGAPRAAPNVPPAASARPPAHGPSAPAPAGLGPAAPRAAFRPGPQPPSAPAAPMPPPAHAAPPAADPPQRPLRQSERNSAVVAFVLHQFPIGHMPVAASRPSLQWSTPRAGDADGLCFPPRDHPRAALVDDADAVAGARAGRAGGTVPQEDPGEVPDRLLEGYDPLGDPRVLAEEESDTSREADPTERTSEVPAVLSEYQWDQRYLARAGDAQRRPEYTWPAWAGHPEGCRETGEPVVLAADTVLDRVGDPAGRVLFADGTPFALRSLPPGHRERGYRRYRVLRPLPVHAGVTAPWFGQQGGGVRYRTSHSVDELVELGHLVELVGDGSATVPENAGAATLRLTTHEVDAAAHAGSAERTAGESEEAQ